MVTASRGLTPAQLEAIAALESRVLAADGGRLKLEWRTLRIRDQDQTRDFLWWSEDGSTLLGFAGLYAFGGATVELAGMVDPAHRRRGIGTALLDAATVQCVADGERKLLLVTPRGRGGGELFAARHCGRLAHSEHAMLLDGTPAPSPQNPNVTLRLTEPQDVPRLAQIMREAFGHTMLDDAAVPLQPPGNRRLSIELGGEVIGGIRTTLDAGRGGIYGFAVTAERRGHGIGRDVLRRACVELQTQGADQIGLEVLTDNDHALRLYESLGFRRVITEDYFELTL